MIYIFPIIKTFCLCITNSASAQLWCYVRETISPVTSSKAVNLPKVDSKMFNRH